jgi:trimethylamine--corrinoid protein Co-methyltransferase
MSEIQVDKGRRGGREARVAARSRPLTEDMRPIRPGMPGGRFRPLADADVLRIHNAALDVLEQIGFADAIPSCVEVITAAGGVMGDDGRLRFPRSLVEDMVARAARRFVLHGQDSRHDMEPWGSNVYFGTAGAAVNVVDPVTGDYRESTAADLYDCARLVDALDNIHFFQRTNVCREIPDPYEMDLNSCYASVAGTTKHVGTSWVHQRHVEDSLEMLHMVAGGEEKWRARPFVSQSNCFVVPPLKFAEDACRCLEAAVRGGMPVLLLSAGQAGATAPAALAGAVVQAVAECLAGIVYVNAIRPGAPAIFGTWPFVSDLRTGAMSGGSPEQALLSAACGQMAQFYDLIGGTGAGMSDSKLLDAQFGAEEALNLALVGNAGTNLVYEAVGMHASLLGVCKASLVAGNDIIASVQRTMKGIDVSDEALSVETIRATCVGGPGHYLGSEQTLSLMQRDYVYPVVGDRWSPNEWNEKGRPDYVSRAVRRTEDLLRRHHPRHIDRSIDDRIRQRFPIKLDRAHMGDMA